MNLTPRLELAAQLCRPPCRLIDIGCDHGYLTIRLLELGAQSAIASDLRPGPLAKARENIKARGLEHKARLMLTDGLTGICPRDGDTIAICGMGGEAIAAILAAAPWTQAGAHRLVLQPMTRSPLLREFLFANGYEIEAEVLAKEGTRLYPLLAARGCGTKNPPADTHSHFLYSSKLQNDVLFGEYLELLRHRYSTMISGLEQGGLDASAPKEILRQLDGAVKKHANGHTTDPGPCRGAEPTSAGSPGR